MTPDECGSLVIPLRRKGKLITYWAQGRCHCLNCKRCQSPRYKEIRLWQGRGMRGANVLTRVHQAIPLHALGYGCSRVLHYREVSAGARGKLVEALNSASGGKYGSLWSARGELTLIVAPGMEEFLRERLTPEAVEDIGESAVERAVMCGIRGMGGILAKSQFDSRVVARSLEGSATSPELNHDQPEEPGSEGRDTGPFIRPSEHDDEVPATDLGCRSRTIFHKLGYTFADEVQPLTEKPGAWSPKDKEAAVMTPAPEHTELLRQIAANTAVLPQMAKDVAEMRRITADYEAGRITGRERDRRIGQVVSRMVN